MAGISDSVYRGLCRRHGADIVVSEMVSADGLTRNVRTGAELLRFQAQERPLGVQLFGADPQRLARAAAWVEEHVQPDFVDLNSGCPVRKVVRRNGGAALLKDRPLFERIVDAMAKAVSIPLTVKLRSGWETGRWVDVEFARAAEQLGAAAVALHPRSAAMKFSGRAVWERIATVKQSVGIPVIGNGDIAHPQDAAAMMQQTGCDSVMVGRACCGNPWLLGQCRQALKGEDVTGVNPEEKRSTVLEHLEAHRSAYGERRAAAEMKKHIAWYMRGTPGASAVRNRVFRAATTAELHAIVGEFWPDVS